MSIASHGQSLKVMTYNLRLNTQSDGVNAWPNRLDKVITLINKYSPDVMGVQEALDGQLNDLKSNLPQYAAVGVGRDDGKTKGEYSAIFYRKDRFSVVKQNTFWLSEQPEVPGSKSWDAAITRVATWAILRSVDGDTIFVINTHFDHMGSLARENSAKLIIKNLPQLASGLPVVMTGDLNCTRDEAPFKALTTSSTFTLLDTAPSNPPGTYCTFSVGEVCRAIDYVLLSKEWKLESYMVIDDNDGTYYPSDHLPVMVMVEKND